ncbi:MAG: hypothetical protein HY581_12060 [Nitrospirae bacterium]|nr:hypothetical protein [Nitrospirota bacterium]
MNQPVPALLNKERACVGLGAVLAVVLLATLLAGCEKLAAGFGRATIPDMGPRLPVSAKIEFDPSLSNAILKYSDACNSPRELRLGAELESNLLQAANQTFQTVSFPGSAPVNVKPDVEIRFALQQSGLELRTDNVYDRLPAELTVEAVVVFRDPSGKVLQERPLKTTRRERILLEPTQKRCEYASMDAFLYDTTVAVAIQFAREARALLDPGSQAAQAGQGSPQEPGQPPSPGVPALSFKATILDENGNLVLESGERVRVRVDLVNTGVGAASGVSVTLAGTPAVIAQFPATTLPVGALRPGESRSVEFSATLPQSVPAQRAELSVSVSEASGGGSPAAQTLVVAMRPAGGVGVQAASGLYDNVDQVPAASAGFQRPETHLVAIGIGAYRDQRPPARKYAARDAELVAAYFQALGGIPAANVRVLQDRKALRPDIEEALQDWLPPRVTADSVVIVYFAGQAMVAPSGETYLVPYEGGTSASRFYPLKELQAALTTLKTRHTLLIFDGSVSRLGRDTRSKSKAPQWDAGGRDIVRLISTTGLQSGLEPEKLRHGLFTYYLLRGLKGEADSNRDGEVTLGELATFLGQAVPSAAKSEFNQEQRPLVSPAISPTSKSAGLMLTKPSAAIVSDRR